MRTLILPKIHSAQDIHHVSREVYTASRNKPRDSPLRIVPSIESARALWNLGGIAGWKSEHGSELGGSLSALLVRFLPFYVYESNGLDFSLQPRIVALLFLPLRHIYLTGILDCADTGIIRSPSRRELLYTRSQIVIAAKAFGLEAIDMVKTFVLISSKKTDNVYRSA